MSTKSKSRISPVIPQENLGTVLEDLKDGDCFIYNGKLFMVTNEYVDCALNLANGVIDEIGLDVAVSPVNITINWTRKGK